jgi:hypothetical protein
MKRAALHTGKSIVSATVVCSMLSSCAYVAPLVAPNGQKPPESLRALSIKGAPPEDCQTAGCIERAIKYGEQWQQHYYYLASQNTMLARAIPAPIIPLSAIAGYRATGNNPDVRLATGYATTAAALYIANGYTNTSKDALIQLEGARALSCVLEKARPLAIPQNGFGGVRNEHGEYIKSLANIQSLYTKLRTSPGMRAITDGDDEDYRTVSRDVYARIDKRLSYYDRVARSSGTAIAELDGVGDRVRGLVDEVVLQTANELAKATPDLAKLKTDLAGLPGLVTALGSIPEDNDDGGATPGDGKTEEKKDKAAAEKSAGADLPQPSKDKEAADKAAKAANAEATSKPSDKKKPSKVKEKEAKSALERIAAIMESNTGALSYVVTKDGILVEGSLTRPRSSEELAAEAKEKKATADKAKKEEDDKQKRRRDVLDSVRGLTEFTDLQGKFEDVAKRAHTLRLTMLAWKNTKSITVGCDEGEPNDGNEVFSVTPKLDTKELVVGEEFKLIVRNSRTVPSVNVVGDSTDKLVATTALSGESFLVTVKANGPIAADKRAVLAIAGLNGRTIRTAFSAKAKAKE